MSSIKDQMSDIGSFIAKLLVILGIVMMVVGGYNLSAKSMAGVALVNKIEFLAQMNPWLFTALGLGVYFLAYIFDGEAADKAVEDVADGVTGMVGGAISTVGSILMPLLPYALLFLGGKWAWDKYQDSAAERAQQAVFDKEQQRFKKEIEQEQALQAIRNQSYGSAPVQANVPNSYNRVLSATSNASPVAESAEISGANTNIVPSY